MPNGHNSHVQTPRVRNGDPQPAPTPAPAPAPAPEPASAKRDLTSWWRQFSKRNLKKDEEKEQEGRGIFGVPLITSIPYANVAISLFNEHGESYIYGYVPIVVAKCGVFLKEKATDVEGIFRLAGSEKRIKELKIAFDTPPRFGKGLDWTGYTVHDAANILRRYFNQLPEPIIPLQHYDPFRAPLRGHQAEAVGHIEGQAPSVGGFDPDAAVRVYQHLIKNLPSLNRQLLLYILDLLAVFAAKSDVNKMTTSNLAAIFQPGILSHPQHDMSPQDYRLSQDVLIFLIDNQDHFLIGMEGTAVDEGTVKHIESGPSTPQARTPTTPNRNKSGLGRSASTSSSAGAESLRKFGGIRRNVSTSSRHSRHSGAVPSPVSPSFATPTSSGVHRSNTVPSKRSPALTGARFSVEKSSDPPTPSVEDPKVELPPPSTDTLPKSAAQAEEPPKPTEEPIERSPGSWPLEKLDVPGRPTEEKIQETKPATVTPALETIPGAFPLPSPSVIPPSEDVTPTGPAQPPHALSPPPVQPAGQRSPHLTPTRERSEFIEAPVDSGPSTELTPAVRTFTQILSKVSPAGDEKYGGRKPNKLQKKQRVASANPSAHSSTHSLTGGNPTLEGPPSPLPPPSYTQPLPSGSKEALPFHPPQHTDTVSSRNSGTTLKPSMSPSASFRSHSTATEYSEAEPADEQIKEEKRSFWKSHKRDQSRATPTASQTDLHGSVPGADKSVGSFGSSSGWGAGGRRSLQYESHQSSDFYTGQETEKSAEKKSPFGWFHKKRQEHKEQAEKKQRAKSPPGSSSDLPGAAGLIAPKDSAAVRGKSMDIPRPKMSDGPTSNAPIMQSSKPLAASQVPNPSTQQGNTAPPVAPTSSAPKEASAQAPVPAPAEATAPTPTPAQPQAQPEAPAPAPATTPSQPASDPNPTPNQPSNSTS